MDWFYFLVFRLRQLKALTLEPITAMLLFNTAPKLVKRASFERTPKTLTDAAGLKPDS
jgi:hypothetical protein